MDAARAACSVLCELPIAMRYEHQTSYEVRDLEAGKKACKVSRTARSMKNQDTLTIFIGRSSVKWMRPVLHAVFCVNHPLAGDTNIIHHMKCESWKLAKQLAKILGLPTA